jgi:uncharacterized protein (TIGR02453 family)
MQHPCSYHPGVEYRKFRLMNRNIAALTGFPAEGIQFLRDLRDNNNKEWFEAHKEAYLRHVQQPALALVVALGEQLQSRFPDIRYDTRTNGSGSLLRLYRDTRFSADKTPYKTNIAMMFTPPGHKKMEVPGFGLQITPEEVDLMAGLFQFTKPQLEAYRAAVLDDRLSSALIEAVRDFPANGYRLDGKTYKRVPAGFDSNHPRAEWLKFSGLYAFPAPLSLEMAQTPELVTALIAHYERMAPLRDWLRQVL